MKTLYVHIGTKKTGTTSIQGFCKNNRNVLESKGYCYPVFPFQYYRVSTDGRNGHFLVGAVWTEDGTRTHDTKKERQIFREGMDYILKLFETYDNVVVSDEQIWKNTYMDRASLWDELREEAEKGNFQVKVIVYIRRQDAYIASLWNQSVKTAIRKDRALMTIEEYMENMPPSEQLDYYQQIERISSVLGKENVIVRVFERGRFTGGSIYSDFLKAIGLELTDDMDIKTDVRNISLMGNTHEIKRILNEIPEMAEADVNNFYRRILQRCAPLSAEEYSCSMMSREEIQAILSKYEESNSRVLKEYIKEDWDTLFDEKIQELPKWQKENPYMQDDIIRFIGMSTASLLKEYGKIKEENRKNQEKIKELKYKLDHPFRTIADRSIGKIKRLLKHFCKRRKNGEINT